MSPEEEIAHLEALFEAPAYWRCAHCGDPITGTGYTWIGPLRQPGESIWDQRRYHLNRPECRQVGEGATTTEETDRA
ncbi:hypothetical protein [Streptomyces hebeiensis]